MASANNSPEDNTPGPRDLAVVTSWSTEVGHADVAEQIESSIHLRPGTIEANTDTGSRSVYDGGDKAQLKATGRPTKEQLHHKQHPSPTASSHLVSHAGDRFQGVSDLQDRSSILDIDLPNDGDGGELSDTTNFAHLVEKSFHHHESRKRFLPYDKLDQLVTRVRVCKELRRDPSRPDAQIEAYADQIWGTSSLTVTRGDPFREPSSNHTDHTTMRRLFTILAFMNLLHLIDDFIESRIYDRHLPFTFNDSNGSGRSATYNLEGITGSTMVFTDWTPCHVDQFKYLQWQLLSPFFSFTPKPRHYVLHESIPLPFNYDGNDTAEGGYGEVRKITIHRAHYHDYKNKTKAPGGSHAESPPLALKKLLRTSNRENDFKRERKNHQNIPEHPNLIRLLASFERRGDYYLIFPWADGNLLDFWQAHPPPGQSEEHLELLWFSKQCLSLAEGLNAIHNPGSLSADGLLPTRTKDHGRHGDLKPQNILWFKDEEGGERSLGGFKYCDFGLSAFHRSISMEENPNGFGLTVTYMAPERDTGYNIGPSYDIFSLGCVLLEFVTWYLDGWKVIETFSKARLEEDRQNVVDWEVDSFFNRAPTHTLSDGQRVPKASLKRSVQKEFDRLRDHSRCVDYLVDLLCLIETRMIRMRPEKRATAKELVTELSGLDQRCRQNKDYTMKKTKDCPRRAGTDLSSLVGNSTSSALRPISSSRGCDTNTVNRVLTDEPVREDNVAQEPEAQAKADPKPAILPEESTLVETGGPDTGAPNGEQPQRKDPRRGSLKYRVSGTPETSYRSEDMMAANGHASTGRGWESDPEREPLVRRPGQEGEQSLPLATVWPAFLGFFCCS